MTMELVKPASGLSVNRRICLVLHALLIIVCSTTSQPIQGLENVALSTSGATCLVGSYNVTYDTACLPAIDGTLAMYHPSHGNGWLTVTLDTASMVTAVDVILDWNSEMGYDNNIRLRVVFSSNQEQVVHLRRPEGDNFDIYRFRILYVESVFTKSVTIAWTAANMPAIVDVNIMGSKQGIRKIQPMTVSCNRSLVDCAYVNDGDVTSSLQLVSSNRVEVRMSSPAEVVWLSLYAHPLVPKSAVVTMSISLVDEDGDQRGHIEVPYRNQGWDTEATWQTIRINSFRLAASLITLRATRDYATLSEVEFYYMAPGLLSRQVVWLGDLPYYDMSLGNLRVHHESPYVIGDMPARPTTTTATTIRPTIPPAITAVSRPGGAAIIGPKAASTPYISTHESPDVSDSGDLKHSGTTSSSRETADFTRGTDTMDPSQPTEAPWPDFFGLKWYWYVSIGIGAFSIILVIIIIVLISRLKRKTFAPNPRPRVVLRSISSIGDPCQLTLNSQSSMPMPYTAFSPVNTTTFGRKDGHAFKAMYYGFDSKHSSVSEGVRSSVTDKYGMKMHDGELSDDCFL